MPTMPPGCGPGRIIPGMHAVLYHGADLRANKKQQLQEPIGRDE